LRGQLERYRSRAKADLPLGAVPVFLRCCVRLYYGIVATEAFGQPGFALGDAELMFQLTLAETVPLAGLRCPGCRPGRSHHLAVQAQPPLAARSTPRPARHLGLWDTWFLVWGLLLAAATWGYWSAGS
jgi:hypothetical protein